MARLIDVDVFKSIIPDTTADLFENCRNCKLLDADDVKQLVDTVPTIDAVSVVRCKDCWKREFDNCPFNEFTGYYPTDDFYCGEGEREIKKYEAD